MSTSTSSRASATTTTQDFIASAAAWAKTQEKREAEHSQFKVRSKRPNSTLNFVRSHDEEFVNGQAEAQPQPYLFLENMNAADQEKLLTQDVIYTLSGLDGNLITPVRTASGPGGYSKIEFMVDTRIDTSLRHLTLQISQLGSYYSTVTHYVENWSGMEKGQVNQALCSALRTILKEYLMMVSHLETMQKKDQLTLQKLWFYIHPTLQTMTIVNSIVVSIEERNAIGGTVLTILHEKAISMIGDDTGRTLCTGLAVAASKPYFVILENWIYKGIIRDPFSEFFISENERDADLVKGHIDQYWEQRYESSMNKCPSFLRKVSDEILKAGKYLNVIRQCGKDVILFMGTTIVYEIHERVYATPIQEAYSFASKSLLNLLIKDYDLMNRLKSVKHHLLMDQGDFIVQFLDLTEAELNKKVDDLNETRLTSLLELALRTSSSGSDPYKDSVKVEIFPCDIKEQMARIFGSGKEDTSFGNVTLPENDNNFRIPGVQAFAFNYDVQWPVSLVLSKRAITCYQLVFRHLFYCKHVERQLCRAWIVGKCFKKVSLMFDREKAAAFSLRQKMLNFVQNLQYYMSFEVIEPAWHTFIGMMTKVQNVDEVLNYHQSFISSVLSDSMLTNPDIQERMSSLLGLCLKFCKKFLDSNVHSSQAKHLSSSPAVDEMNSQFTEELVEFLNAVSITVHNPDKSTKGANIIHRMNFNSFYTSALEGNFQGTPTSIHL